MAVRRMCVVSLAAALVGCTSPRAVAPVEEGQLTELRLKAQCTVGPGNADLANP